MRFIRLLAGGSSPNEVDKVIPDAPGALPLIGHTYAILRDPLAFLTSLQDVTALARIRVGPASAVMVCDPDLVRHILLDDRTFDKGGPLTERAKEISGNGLASCPRSEHRRQRKICQPAFHQANLNAYAQTMNEQIELNMRTWRDGQVIEVGPTTLAISSDIAFQTLFGGALQGAALEQFGMDTNTIFRLVYRRLLMPRSLNRIPLSGNRLFGQALCRLRKATNAVAELYKSGWAPAENRSNLISLLMAGNGEDKLSDEELGDQIITFLTAGIETTGSALAWTLYNLARHPKIQQQLQAEADKLANRRPTTDDLQDTPVTSAIVNESLRMYPPSLLARTVARETSVGGHILPVGTSIFMSPYLIHRRAELYPDPESFLPSRWMEGRREYRANFLPFGAGARICIGNNFALTEVSLAILQMAQRWTFEPVDHAEIRPAMGIIMQPDGLQLRLKERKSQEWH
ncbi:cytochrome P450 [Streptomyces sp. NPDC060085]|uniref:cytochrome P450 n=1 Tax=Streptomyces sp. NPDC060085 TaxID=3347054 RepID=UPI003660312C